MTTRRGLCLLFLVGCLSASGCAAMVRPPAVNNERKNVVQDQDQDQMEHAVLEKELSMYSD